MKVKKKFILILISAASAFSYISCSEKDSEDYDRCIKDCAAECADCEEKCRLTVPDPDEQNACIKKCIDKRKECEVECGF